MTRLEAIRERLRREWKRLLCKHTHTFHYEMGGARREYGKPQGSRKCHTAGLALRGCYICGKVRVVDYAA